MTPHDLFVFILGACFGGIVILLIFTVYFLDLVTDIKPDPATDWESINSTKYTP